MLTPAFPADLDVRTERGQLPPDVRQERFAACQVPHRIVPLVAVEIDHAPAGPLAGQYPDGLRPEIKPDQRAARRQTRGDLDQRQDGGGHGAA